MSRRTSATQLWASRHTDITHLEIKFSCKGSCFYHEMGPDSTWKAVDDAACQKYPLKLWKDGEPSSLCKIFRDEMASVANPVIMIIINLSYPDRVYYIRKNNIMYRVDVDELLKNGFQQTETIVVL